MSSIPRPHNPYILIRLERDKEREAKEKQGILYIPPAESLMQYNLPSGEIVAMSPKASEYFPQAKIGHQLLLHHFVQGVNETDARVEHLVHQDDEYNYYVVTPCEHNGKGVEAYGVYDGENIIPNKDYLFLETDTKKIPDLPQDELLNQSLEVSTGGLLVFREWKESRESKEERQNFLKKQVEDLSKSGNHKKHIQEAIAEKEMEMGAISQDINKQKYETYTVAFCNPELSETFNHHVKSGSRISMLNIAAYTKVVFMGMEYIVSKVKYIGFLYND